MAKYLPDRARWTHEQHVAELKGKIAAYRTIDAEGGDFVPYVPNARAWERERAEHREACGRRRL